MQTCTYCGKTLPENTSVCTVCGFPILGSNEEKHKFLYMKSILHKADMTNAESGIKKARTVLYVAAGLAFLNALFGIPKIDGPKHLLAVIMTAVLGVIFIVFGIFLKKNPLPFSIAGLVLSVIFLHGSVTGIILILLLAYGVWCSATYDKAERKLKALERKMSDRAGE